MGPRDNRSRSALRGTTQQLTQLALPPEEIDEPTDAQIEIDHQEDVDTAKLASLKGNPGWELIKREFNVTIEKYRSGKVLQAAIAQGKTNAEVGELTRTTNIVADELEKIVNTVEAAAIALEEDNSGKSQGQL